MDTGSRNRRGRYSTWSLIVAASVVVAMALVSFAAVGCDSGAVKTVITGESSDSETWAGNGGENNDECTLGGSLYWVLTPGGSGELISGTLHVTFVGGATGDFNGFFEGGGGAMKFVSTGSAPVESAYADYTYNGTLTNVVLTISHVVSCNTTTTEGQETTTTEEQATTTSVIVSGTTTTVLETTTTAVGEVTSTTAVDDVTTTTAVGEVTSTTAVGDVTSTTGVADLTTAGRIDTGGGGTSGPNVMLWLVVSLFGALAVAFGGSAIWSALKQRGAR